jgi:hypothetical protein
MTELFPSDPNRLRAEWRRILHDCRQPLGALGSLITTLEIRLAAHDTPDPEEWTRMTKRLRRICEDLSVRLDQGGQQLKPPADEQGREGDLDASAARGQSPKSGSG